MNQPSKPFNIDKRKVYEAYLQVRSNGGAAGVDGVTIEQFESVADVLARIADLSASRLHELQPAHDVRSSGRAA
jgi:hypothetical protein